MENLKISDSILQVSIVCAVYNESACLPELVARLEQTLALLNSTHFFTGLGEGFAITG